MLDEALRDEAHYDVEWTRHFIGGTRPIDRRTLYTWTVLGKIKALRLSRRCVRYRGSEIRAFIERVARESE